MATISGLHVNVFRAVEFPDRTNGGVSSTHKTLTLILPQGGPFTPGPDAPAVYLRERKVAGETYLHVVPEPPNEKGQTPTWWMFGGNFIYASDSRFPSKYPIPIHDRREAR